jgi:hypothetical protein
MILSKIVASRLCWAETFRRRLRAPHLRMPISTTSLQGVAIVTGASQGLGRAIALRLAQDGYSVAINDIPEKIDAVSSLVEEISRDVKVRAIPVVGDVTEEEEVKTIIAKTVADLGDLSVVRFLPTAQITSNFASS